MTHQDAVKDLAVERYLLGELTGGVRDQFEEHLFDCQECTAELKDGVLFLEAGRAESFEPARAAIRTERKPFAGLAWLWQGWTLGPALAACLAVIVYQSAVLMPRMRTELAQVETPAVVSPLVLANAGARGDSTIPDVVAPRHGFYALSVDVPPAAGATAYRCSLYAPSGELLWQLDITPQQARDSVTIHVPATTAREGINELRVQSIFDVNGRGHDLANYRYKVSFAK